MNNLYNHPYRLNIKQPLFVSIEGIGGAGKTDLAYHLTNELRHKGLEVVSTKEPSGSEFTVNLKNLSIDTTQWSPESLILLYTAIRRNTMEKTIKPALDKKQCVITDRFVDSTRVYQALHRGPLRSYVDFLHATMIGREPDLTFILDINSARADKRKQNRGDPKDLHIPLDLKHQERLRDSYLLLAFEDSSRYFVLDATGTKDSVLQSALKITLQRLAELETLPKERGQ